MASHATLRTGSHSSVPYCVTLPSLGLSPHAERMGGGLYKACFVEKAMQDAESEQPQDDLGLEVTDIDQTDTAAPISESSHTALRSRSASRRRWQLAFTAALVILAILVILVTTAPARNLVVGVFMRMAPSSTPTLIPGVDLFYFQGSPP